MHSKQILFLFVALLCISLKSLADLSDDFFLNNDEKPPKNQKDDDADDPRYDTNFRGDNIQTSYIEKSFNNSKNSFSCQLMKGALRTGDSGANLSPEDIKIVAAMGDALSTGIGLWGGLNVEFRGAAFTIGGDATIDGLVTFPNILSEFSPNLDGLSHGMGSVTTLPDNQFNVAKTGAESDNMPEQAKELVSRLHKHYTDDELSKKWVMTFLTVGTEELCTKCDEPNIKALRTALLTLKRQIPRVFLIIVGPIHVAKSSLLNYNLLKPRCPCLSKLTNQELRKIQTKWSEELLKLEVEFSSRKYSMFPVLALPRLTIESKNPEQLFIAKLPLLNRKGHTYAAKWLWNRLISGPKYDASAISFSEENYYCPPVVCPYFRTPANIESCRIMTLDEYKRRQQQAEEIEEDVFHQNQTILDQRRDSIKKHIGFWIAGPVMICTIVVFILGTVFYCHGIRATKGRFEHVPGV